MDGSSLGEKNKTEEGYLEKPHGPLLTIGDIVIRLCLEAATNIQIIKTYEITAIKIGGYGGLDILRLKNG